MEENSDYSPSDEDDSEGEERGSKGDIYVEK